jgi:hypothetical protein
MRNYSLIPGMAVAIAALLIAGCGTTRTALTVYSSPTRPATSPSPSSPPSPGTVVLTARPPYCVPAQLQLSAGPRISEATEQDTLIVEFHNTAKSACYLSGYPEVVLRDRFGTRLPFGYERHGDQMITGQPPLPVTLRPGGIAYAAVNQNSCTGSTPAEQRRAATIDVTLPGLGKPLTAELPQYPILDYCGAGQLGNEADVTPIEPTIAGIYPHSGS